MLEMGVDTEGPGFVRNEGLRVYGPRGILDLAWPALNDWPGYGLVRTRIDFDELLARRAQQAGAVLYESTEATTPVMDRGWVAGAQVRELQQANGDAAPDAVANGNPAARRKRPEAGPTRTIRAKFVLAADGASSRFAGQAGVKRDPKRPLGIAARRYYRWDRAQVPWLEAWLDLYEGEKVLPGYGWIFPIDDEVVNVGAGLLNTFHGFKDLSAQRVFDVFIKMLPADWGLNEDTAIGPVRSGPLPMGFNRRPLAEPGVLVVGDAGGLVNPFNGEGISYAMETGQMAAELVFDALEKGRPGLAQVYPTLLRQRYGKYFAMGNVFVKVIGNPKFMSFATRHGLHREWLMQFALRMMANLTDGPKGDVHDKLLAALEAVAPSA
jgi:geranylgeranyl reductase family protein